MKKIACKLGGIALIGAGVVSVFLIKWKEPEPEEAEIIRPIASLVLAEPEGTRSMDFPGKTSAADSVDLAFEVGGTIEEKLVDKGEKVKKGDVLARLNKRTFISKVNAAKAQLEQARADFNRTQQLFATGNASQAQLDASQAKFTVAQSDVEDAEKALEDTELVAEFDGVIAVSYIDQFQTISPGAPVYRLQSATGKIKVEINVAGSLFGAAQRDDVIGQVSAAAIFDFLDGPPIPLTVSGWESVADPVTQTFLVSFLMDKPEGANILPGMTVTVRATRKQEVNKDELTVPFQAIVADGTGQHFAWLLVPEVGGAHFTASKTNVSVRTIDGDEYIVTEGLAIGDRIATAGMRVLIEGQKVRLIEEKDEPAS